MLTGNGSYCAAAQRPFQWRSDAEIDAMPIRMLRHVEMEAQTWGVRVSDKGNAVRYRCANHAVLHSLNTNRNLR